MITQSGCFGGGNPSSAPIDDLKEASQMVDDIVSSARQSSSASNQAAIAGVTMLLGQYARRIRLLTYAVLAIAAVLVIKEL